MTVILAQIGDQSVPLKDCSWIQRRPCGCVVSALMAVSGGDAYVTAEQAHKHLEPRKRDRDKDLREGLVLELISMATYRADIGGNWECDQHKPPLSGPAGVAP